MGECFRLGQENIGSGWFGFVPLDAFYNTNNGEYGKHDDPACCKQKNTKNTRGDKQRGIGVVVVGVK